MHRTSSTWVYKELMHLTWHYLNKRVLFHLLLNTKGSFSWHIIYFSKLESSSLMILWQNIASGDFKADKLLADDEVSLTLNSWFSLYCHLKSLIQSFVNQWGILVVLVFIWSNTSCFNFLPSSFQKYTEVYQSAELIL